MSDLPSIDSMTYEAAYQELQTIIAALERGEQTLEEALKLYERGQALVKRCMTLLDQAELQVQILQGNQLMDASDAI